MPQNEGKMYGSEAGSEPGIEVVDLTETKVDAPNGIEATEDNADAEKISALRNLHAEYVFLDNQVAQLENQILALKKEQGELRNILQQEIVSRHLEFVEQNKLTLVDAQRFDFYSDRLIRCTNDGVMQWAGPEDYYRGYLSIKKKIEDAMYNGDILTKIQKIFQFALKPDVLHLFVKRMDVYFSNTRKNFLETLKNFDDRIEQNDNAIEECSAKQMLVQQKALRIYDQEILKDPKLKRQLDLYGVREWLQEINDRPQA